MMQFLFRTQHLILIRISDNGLGNTVQSLDGSKDQITFILKDLNFLIQLTGSITVKEFSDKIIQVQQLTMPTATMETLI